MRNVRPGIREHHSVVMGVMQPSSLKISPLVRTIRTDSSNGTEALEELDRALRIGDEQRDGAGR